MKTQRDPQQVAEDFRDQLIRLLDKALTDDRAKVFALVDVLEAQLVSLRMRQASRPW